MNVYFLKSIAESKLFFLILIASVLLAGIPFLLSFTPYIDAYGPKAFIWDYSAFDDKLFIQKIAILLSAFLLTIVAFVIVVSDANKPMLFDAKFFISVFLFVLIFHIGWKNYPFWINGLHNTPYSIDGGRYDPKALLPLAIPFIGSIWGMGVLLLYFFSAVSPFFIIGFFALKKLSLKSTLALFVILFFNILLFYLTPDYMQWFLD